MVSISFQNSDEFKFFTYKVCNNLSKTKLNQLRSAIAKELGHHHLSTFYRALDDQSFNHAAPDESRGSALASVSEQERGPASSFEDLGFSAQQASDIKKMINPENGRAVLVSGIAGSGKTKTSRALLTNIVDMRCKGGDFEPKSVAIESDRIVPIAHTTHFQPGFDTTGESFKLSLQSAARMAPDCLFFDEIRHKSVVGELINKIQAGIQVVATIHAQHALAIPARLKNLGMANPYDHKLFSGFIYQSLVKSLCKHCSTLVSMNHDGDSYRESVMRLIQATNLNRDYSAIRKRNHEGCDHCYKGTSQLTLVAEVVPVTEDLMKTLATDGALGARRNFVEQGGTTITAHAIEKVLAGEVDPIDAEGRVGRMDIDIE